MPVTSPRNDPRKVVEDTWRQLCAMSPDDAARRAKAEFSENSIRFRHFGAACEVRLGERFVFLEGKELNPFMTLIVLHYLTGAKDMGLSGELISFRELWGGDIYYEAFASRAIRPMAEHFGPAPEKLIKAGKPFNARVLEMGDASIELLAFPRIPLIFVVWGGDEELPHSANVLFDSTVNEHLHTEDISVLSSLAASKLINSRI